MFVLRESSFVIGAIGDLPAIRLVVLTKLIVDMYSGHSGVPSATKPSDTTLRYLCTRDGVLTIKKTLSGKFGLNEAFVKGRFESGLLVKKIKAQIRTLRFGFVIYLCLVGFLLCNSIWLVKSTISLIFTSRNTTCWWS
jgi:hypothetical protein